MIISPIKTHLSADEYRKEIKRLDYNIRRRVKGIEKLGTKASQYTPNRYREITQEHYKPIKDMTKKELKTYYRQLFNLNTAKSSTVKGAKAVRQTFGHTEDILNSFDDERKTKFFSLYDKIYEQYHEYGLRFKYDIFDVTADIMVQHSDRVTEDVIQDLMWDLDALYDRHMLQDYDVEELRIDFIQIIKQLREYYL